MVALLTQCCCGCTLRTGTIILGILYVIGGLYMVIASSIGLAAIEAIESGKEFNIENGLDNESGLKGENQLTDLINNLQTSYNLEAATWFITVNLVVRSIELLCSLLMLAGALLDKPQLLPPWIGCEIIIAILSTIVHIAIGIQFALNEDGAVLAFAHFAGLLVGICLVLYYIYVVYSHYKTLLQSQENVAVKHVGYANKI